MKKSNFPSLAEKIILALISLLVIVILICSFLLQRERSSSNPQEPTEEPLLTEPASGTEPQLSGPEYYLPDNLMFGKKLPTTIFQFADGTEADLNTLSDGSAAILMYWGSWCPWCKEQLENLEGFQEIADAANAKLILIDKTDPEKEETVQKAEAWLAEKGFQDVLHVYDIGLEAYQAYGMKRIPTTIILDSEGYVRSMSSDVLDSCDALTELLQQAENGNAESLMNFLQNNMMNEDGGLFLSYRRSSAASPSGHDVLSESMGLLMQCAVLMEDHTLFDRCWHYVSENMTQNGVIVWYLGENGKKAGSNALLDDIRISDALYKADRKWGGYYEPASALVCQLLARNNYSGKPSSFYDFSQRRAGSSIALAYGDLAALEALSELDAGMLAALESLKQTIQDGFISDAFPLYYSSFDYKQQKYASDSLNMAEALMTLYHLSAAGMLRAESLAWLKHAVLTDTLAARYHTDGSPVQGYQYHSTAVYAFAALIAQNAGDAELYQGARLRMERARIADPESPLFGSFTMNSGSDINAFDQLLPLLVYLSAKNAKFC